MQGAGVEGLHTYTGRFCSPLIVGYDHASAVAKYQLAASRRHAVSH